MKNERIIFIDLDDTVADFRKSAELLFKRKLGEYCRDITDIEWEKINNIDFYESLKLKDGAIELVNYAKNLKSYKMMFLSAIPSKINRMNAVKGKIYWINLFFPNTDFIFVDSSKDKIKYAEGNILIDDKKDIIDLWNESQGYGIICDNCNNSLLSLQKLLDILK